MNRDEQLVGETKRSIPGKSSVSYLGSLGRMGRASFRRNMWADLRDDLGRVLSAGVRRNVRSVHHNEETFRYLLANEGKRSNRSGRIFKVFLVYLAGPGGGAVRMDGKVTSKLLPALSGVLRETDYIGWYRDGHIVGGVLTALEDHSAEEVSCRIEQRFVGGLRGSFPVEEFSRLRVRFFWAQEFERIESADRVFAVS